MTAWTRRGLAAAAGLLIVFGLPLAGKWARRGAAERCALDGVAIDPAYRVRVVDERGEGHAFCCIHCAEAWLDRRPARPRAVLVTDEATGKEVSAASAWFVRSLVVTVPHTRNRVHAFGTRADAGRHARAARGVLLLGSERPFAAAAAGGRADGHAASGPPR